MSKRDLLLLRLSAIADSIEDSGHGLALIALGSAGLNSNRLDNYSDLDFFVIVEAGYKDKYIGSLDWLSRVAPVAYQYRNTMDGYKILFQDSVFCEFAVFEKHELVRIPFAPGRVIWKRSDMEESIAIPAKDYSPPEGGASVEWLLGEVLTNLLVGLSRYRRGERLSAARFVQGFAVDRLIELYEHSVEKSPLDRDPFSNERRLEQRYPELALILPNFIQGYERTPESAREILNYLSDKFPVCKEMRAAILELCE
jgi:hypothetical protein